jgi:hypothetical protein
LLAYRRWAQTALGRLAKVAPMAAGDSSRNNSSSTGSVSSAAAAAQLQSGRQEDWRLVSVASAQLQQQSVISVPSAASAG